MVLLTGALPKKSDKDLMLFASFSLVGVALPRLPPPLTVPFFDGVVFDEDGDDFGFFDVPASSSESN